MQAIDYFNLRIYALTVRAMPAKILCSSTPLSAGFRIRCGMVVV
jgi:hypothetical protein